MTNKKSDHFETTLAHAGRHPEHYSGSVNTPVHRTSTVVFPTLEAYDEAQSGSPFYETSEGVSSKDFSYGTTGTPTNFGLRKALAALEGSEQALVFPSGLCAITIALLSFLKTGDHLLMVDSAYGPTRRFCNKQLKRLGIETTYYDPQMGGDIAKLIQKNTRIVFTESPGSLTFEVQDIPAISAAVKAVRDDIVVMMDNSWATPIYFRAFEKGVDVTIQAGTKYINGHADVLLGVVAANGAHFDKIFETFHHFGTSVSPDDCYLVARGLRTLPLRLKQHEKTALEVANWLKDHKKVSRILHPAFPECEGHALWKRDFSGSTGLFSIILDKHYDMDALARMIDPMQYFSIGASWGGFESLVLPQDPAASRTATKWEETRSCLRLYTGLEHADDLIRDLDAALGRL
jgi:cystathionine beta-lyase